MRGEKGCIDRLDADIEKLRRKQVVEEIRGIWADETDDIAGCKVGKTWCFRPRR